ncbi:hypothetical protein NEOLEDRAFT_1133147 [Neolentinus lepideus HHB14362 ss-1]|uniref:Uncharacterized protein n=1 Tax=Neolentinus lepideus HHB14362 ss-1 TaxID=1314782 RepID=A0A165STN4_9AGAM|nr:hypothetical protein NEOLEDRAFT_1133147 [Neolentinus lepideus HHB14362 ss-1]
MASPSAVVLQIQSNVSSSPFESGNSAQYLYGFTITFVALFIAFAACAYSSRRGRRRIMAIEHIDWNPPLSFTGSSGSVDQPRPKYEEVWLDEKTSYTWSDLKPLSGAVVREPLNETVTPASKRLALNTNVTNTNDRSPSPDTPFYAESRGDQVLYVPPQPTTVLQQLPQRSTSPEPPPASGDCESPVRSIQVSMLISMPCPVPLRKRRASEHGLGDVTLGVASIPWECDLGR